MLIQSLLLTIALAVAQPVTPMTEAAALEHAARDAGLSDVRVFMLMESYLGKPARQDLPAFLIDVGLTDIQAYMLAEDAQGRQR